jgi:hypothetical protein
MPCCLVVHIYKYLHSQCCDNPKFHINIGNLMNLFFTSFTHKFHRYNYPQVLNTTQYFSIITCLPIFWIHIHITHKPIQHEFSVTERTKQNNMKSIHNFPGTTHDNNKNALQLLIPEKHALNTQKYKISNLYDHYKNLQPKLPNTDKYSSGVHRHNALTVLCNTRDKQCKISKHL